MANPSVSSSGGIAGNSTTKTVTLANVSSGRLFAVEHAGYFASAGTLVLDPAGVNLSFTKIKSAIGGGSATLWELATNGNLTSKDITASGGSGNCSLSYLFAQDAPNAASLIADASS